MSGSSPPARRAPGASRTAGRPSGPPSSGPSSHSGADAASGSSAPDASGPEADTSDPGETPRRLLRPIVMIGLMGAGKSSVGLRLAGRLGVSFTDSDAEIEAAARMTIPEIFATFGEAHFRDGERRVIARLMKAAPGVLATGGGAFLNAQTRTLIAERAISVWIKADLDLLVSRTAGRTHRPLLNTGDPRQTLARLIDERYPVYAEADVTVESAQGLTHEQMAGRIVAALDAHAAAGGKAAFA